MLRWRASVQALRMSKALENPGLLCCVSDPRRTGGDARRSTSFSYSTFPCIASVKNLPESVGVKSHDLIRAGSHSGS